MLIDTTEPGPRLVSTPEAASNTPPAGIQEQSDLHEFFVLLRRHVLLIVLVTLTTGAATYAASVRQAKQYTSGTTLLYTPSSSNQDPTRAIDTVVGISGSNAVLAPVAKRDKLSFDTVKRSISISGDANADIIHVTARAASAALAANLANDVARALISYSAIGQKHLLQAQISSLQKQLAALAGKTDPSAVAAASDLRTQLAVAEAQLAVAKPQLSVLSAAVPPTTASSPHPKRDGAIGLLAGLVLGVLLAAVRDRLDRRVRAVDEVEALYRAPMLGMVPFAKGRHTRAEMLADFSGSEPLADAYRTIRANLALFRPRSGETAVIVVTSAAADEGKSAVAANVAHSLSVIGRNVLAVSADLHNPTLHEYFEASPIMRQTRGLMRRSGSSPVDETPEKNAPAGLVQVLAGKRSLSKAVREIPLTPREQANGGSLGLLADKTTFFDPGALFSSGPMLKFLKKAKKHYDVIVFDTPPLLANADAALLGQHADVVVLVARLDLLTKNQARRAVRIMSATRLAATGVIVTGEVDESIYGYGYRHDAVEDEIVEPAESEPDAPVETPQAPAHVDESRNGHVEAPVGRLRKRNRETREPVPVVEAAVEKPKKRDLEEAETAPVESGRGGLLRRKRRPIETGPVNVAVEKPKKRQRADTENGENGRAAGFELKRPDRSESENGNVAVAEEPKKKKKKNRGQNEIGEPVAAAKSKKRERAEHENGQLGP